MKKQIESIIQKRDEAILSTCMQRYEHAAHPVEKAKYAGVISGLTDGSKGEMHTYFKENLNDNRTKHIVEDAQRFGAYISSDPAAGKTFQDFKKASHFLVESSTGMSNEHLAQQSHDYVNSKGRRDALEKTGLVEARKESYEQSFQVTERAEKTINGMEDMLNKPDGKQRIFEEALAHTENKVREFNQGPSEQMDRFFQHNQQESKKFAESIDKLFQEKKTNQSLSL